MTEVPPNDGVFTPPAPDPLEDLQAANAEKIQSCIRRGVTLDPLMQLKLRLDVLTEFALAGPVRESFEYTYETVMGEYLTQLLEQASHPSLVVPTSATTRS